MKGTEEIVLSDGTVLPALVKCEKCKWYICKNWGFCPHCGNGKKVLGGFKQNDVKSFEEIYQAIVLEFRKYGLKDPSRENVKEMLDESEKQGAIKKVDKEK